MLYLHSFLGIIFESIWSEEGYCHCFMSALFRLIRFFFSNAFYSQNQFKIRHGDGVDHAEGVTGPRTLVRM